MSYAQINFNRPMKRWASHTLHSTSKAISNYITLGGPSFHSHYNDVKLIVRGTGKCKVFELCSTTTEKIKNLNIKNVKVYNQDVNEYRLSRGDRFVNLDFCKNLSTNFHIVKNIYNQLLNLNTTKNKELIITFSFRKDGLKDSIKSLCKLFNINNNFTKNSLFPKKSFYTSDKAMYIVYRDGCPMCSFKLNL